MADREISVPYSYAFAKCILSNSLISKLQNLLYDQVKINGSTTRLWQLTEKKGRQSGTCLLFSDNSPNSNDSKFVPLQIMFIRWYEICVTCTEILFRFTTYLNFFHLVCNICANGIGNEVGTRTTHCLSANLLNNTAQVYWACTLIFPINHIFTQKSVFSQGLDWYFQNTSTCCGS